MSGQAGDPNLPTGSSDATNTISTIFDQDVVFLAVDFERHEHRPHPITEIGVATLDTRDLRGVAPGSHGENWFARMKVRHFRVEEQYNLRNGDFVAGHPDKFLFGPSEWISEQSVTQTLINCYSILDLSSTARLQQYNVFRDIVEVGHDLKADHKYMRDLGLPSLMPNVIAQYDTQNVALKRSLGVLLLAIGLPAKYLHNAGNDATMTLQLFIAMKVISSDQFSAFIWRAYDRVPGPIIQATTWATEPKQDSRPPHRAFSTQGQGTVTVVRRATTSAIITTKAADFDFETDFPPLGSK